VKGAMVRSGKAEETNGESGGISRRLLLVTSTAINSVWTHARILIR